MLLMFPTGLQIKEKDTCSIRSLNKEDFNKRLSSKIALGWEVQEMSSNFRKTIFGGVVSYKAELTRGIAGEKKQ